MGAALSFAVDQCRGFGPLAPLTTLMDAARLLGEDVGRLADAQQEAEDAAGRRLGAGRITTPT